jgi:hypothetical protein
MRILEMILPRLETMAAIASDRSIVRDPKLLADLREDYRYMASVSLSLIPDLERQLVDLPDPISPDAPIEEKISFQMALIRQTNRLHRAVEADVRARQVSRDGRRQSGMERI